MKKTRIAINPKYQENIAVINFINCISDKFQEEGIILHNERNVIKEFELDKSDVILRSTIVKRYKRPSFIQCIIYSFFRSTKAKRAFSNAVELHSRNISTPEQIAFVEEWDNGFFQYGYYLSAKDNALPIKEKLIDPEEFDLIMAEDFAAFVAELHQKGIMHHDLNSTNILYHNKGERYTFSVIDINRMVFLPIGKQFPRHKCFDNLTRFTGRMDLFEYVLKHYIAIQGWDAKSSLKKAVEIKVRHDKLWRRRKTFFKKLLFKK